MKSQAKKGAVTSGVSFTPSHWEMVQTAIRNGYSRSRLMMLALETLAAQRPEIFLSADYSSVINSTDEKSSEAAA